ncbi:4Fe-4S dicluster domain-containing protein [Nitratiruptor tergarcus]|uniref:4Fe-4S dicluster domain-containing protein n=1 Tax=Nitratiruptor tergarcus DSM 16512 TaxID=1069081 RepID=A0A1W1WSI0_9BACT|nr:4Fe-4S dicluster domain-containing protein [Nitratiruptor tergarcus]SMC09254.1 4Fe-4S dicluster domain-containing protein [Nitratiruptor tergarcus DSM 16512]
MIRLDAAKCVRYYSKLNECNSCEQICPADVIETQEGSLALKQDGCIDCGACVGVCPTEALQLSDFNVTEFFFDFVKSDEKIISCKSNFVCLAALGVEYLIALGAVKEIVLDIGHCETCDIKEKCFAQIEHNIAEANYVLEAIEQRGVQAKKLGVQKENVPDRREFFNIFTLKNVVKTKAKIDEQLEALEDPTVGLDTEQIRAIRQKSIPNKRKLLFTLLKKIEKPANYKYLENEHLSFTSEKEIDESCDNCSICYRICPTEALSTTSKASAILFDPLLCVRCHLCHDVCEKGSIKLAEYFDTKQFFEPEAKILAKFTIVRCEDCGICFTYFGGEKICQRCKIEEEEAKQLWGIE